MVGGVPQLQELEKQEGMDWEVENSKPEGGEAKS